MALVPVAPTISAPSASGFTITVNADGNPTPPATYYTFKLITGAGVFYLNSLGALQATKVYLPVLSITVTTATPNAFYTVILTASNDAVGTGESLEGPPATVTTFAANPLSAAFSNVFSTTIMANWYANGNPDGTNYEVQICENSSFVSGVVSSGFITTLGFIFTDLLPQTPYFARVRARDSALDLTGFTLLGSTQTLVAPNPVEAIRVYNLLTERGYLITWGPSQETNIDHYNVYRGESPTDITNFQVLSQVPKPVTSYLDRVPFTFGIVFYYLVTAVDDGGNESSLAFTTPAQENTYHSFEEQPFFNTIVSSDFITDEIPTGSIDGVNALFTTLFPYRKNSVEVYLNGVKLFPINDFTEGPLSQQLTFVSPPDIGGMLRINYKKFGI